jgi:hypothetical protein
VRSRRINSRLPALDNGCTGELKLIQAT